MADAATLSLARHLLPNGAGPYEIAAFAALAEVMPIDTAAASTVWDPWTCPAHLLPALAYALSVDLWHDDWPETKKRSVIAASPELHDLKTSIGGYRRYLDIVDCTLVDYIAPPKGFVLGPTFSDDERAAWLRGLPELRLYTGNEVLAHDAFGLEADVGFLDVHFLTPDRGRAMSSRKARIYDPATGAETQIGPVDFDRIDDGQTTVAFERLTVPGAFDPAALTFDLAFLDLGALIPPDPKAAPVFTWRADTVGRQGAFSLLDALPYGYGVVDARPERVPLRRLMGWGLYADHGFLDVAFLDDADAALGFYDAFKIARIGERSGTPLVEAGGFFDLDYFGWPTHTLHLLVDATGPFDPAGLYLDIGFLDRAAAVPDDLTRFDAAMRAAYVASGPGSDHVTLSTETTRLLTLSDGIPLDGSFHFGKRIPRGRA